MAIDNITGMVNMKSGIWMASTLAMVTLSGCASLGGAIDDRPMGRVDEVQTDYSLGLRCLGERIDRSGGAPLNVYVNPIRDLTVPSEFDDRRLSSGGQWWLITALQKIEARKINVISVDGKQADSRQLPSVELSGAWTQDDVEVGSQEGGLNAVLSRWGIEFGARRSYDVIAGDFVSSRNGRVAHASAISVVVGSARAGMNLTVEDGDREALTGFRPAAERRAPVCPASDRGSGRDGAHGSSLRR